jgi:hypothetical protein
MQSPKGDEEEPAIRPSRATMQSPKGDEEEPAIRPSRATMQSPKGDEVGVPPSRAAARGQAPPIRPSLKVK